MRHALLSWIAWFSALQAIHSPFGLGDDAARIVGMAGVLGTLTVLVYRLGVWRQQMEMSGRARHCDQLRLTMQILLDLFSGYNQTAGLLSLFSGIISWN